MVSQARPESASEAHVERRGRKVVLGVCGIGHGHSLRESVVIDGLLRRGHRIVVLAFAESLRFLRSRYPGVECIPVWVPWVHGSGRGVDFALTGHDEDNRCGAGWADNYLAMDQAIRCLGGKPDILIADYEPVTAQLAYALGKPLVSLDQQSKFLGFETPDVGGFTREEEAARLRLFFPAAIRRYAASFFPVDFPTIRNYPVKILPPILRPGLAPDGIHTGVERMVLIYLSPYGRTDQNLAEFVEVCGHLDDWRFVLYAPGLDAPASPSSNVICKGFSDSGFLADLRSCAAVVSTAGHQLISEAVFLGKPVYAMPFAIYEQTFNAAMVAKHGLGTWQARLEADCLGEFLERLPFYQVQIAEHKGRMGQFDGAGKILAELCRDFDL
ncbi:MAG: glycosyltransferase family protein [Thermoanaerobaculaceae bacterium]